MDALPHLLVAPCGQMILMVHSVDRTTVCSTFSAHLQRTFDGELDITLQQVEVLEMNSKTRFDGLLPAKR
eukprot:1961760-Amphidinium_carterae.1